MKCAFIASFYGPYYSNFVASMIAFDKKMKQEGHSVFYILPKETEKFEWMSIFKEQNNNVYFLEYKPYSFNNFFALRKIFKHEKVDLIYSHMCGWDLTARFAAPFTPVIWHMHMNVNVINKVKRFKNFIKFKFLGFGKTYHIAVSQPSTDAINYFKPHNKCVYIPNSLDLSRLNLVDNKIKRNTKNLLIFGWEPYIKGLDITLDACEKLVEDGKNFKLLVSSQEKTYKYINQRYEKLPDWIKLLEPTSDISSIYNRADIMISASRSEGFSYAMLEALYFGLPIVYSNIKPCRWCLDFKGTFAFDLNSINSFKKVLNDTLEYSITSNEVNFNRNLIQEKYSFNSWVNAVYKELELIYNKKK